MLDHVRCSNPRFFWIWSHVNVKPMIWYFFAKPCEDNASPPLARSPLPLLGRSGPGCAPARTGTSAGSLWGIFQSAIRLRWSNWKRVSYPQNESNREMSTIPAGFDQASWGDMETINNRHGKPKCVSLMKRKRTKYRLGMIRASLASQIIFSASHIFREKETWTAKCHWICSCSLPHQRCTLGKSELGPQAKPSSVGA